MKVIYTVLLITLLTNIGISQSVPARNENIPYLVTFGEGGNKSWGDDDFCQVFFFVVPKTHKKAFYIRIFDPGTGGKIDEKKGEFNTRMKYSIYGGNGCISNKAAQGTNPIKGYDSGNLLATKTFTNELDEKWYTFGPLNPTSGELSEQYGGYVIKLIIKGLEGDDGNLYKLVMSASANTNLPVEGGNAFTFEYTFRMKNDPKQVSHVYPYIDSKVTSVKQSNYDWDFDGDLKIISNTRLAIHLKKSGNGNWGRSEHKVLAKEKESSFDVQFHKNKSKPVNNNNIAFNITNQYGESMPFFTIPIGGIPKPKSTIKLIPGIK